MAQTIEIVPQPLTEAAFSPYGQAILLPDSPPTKQGGNWDCWFGLGQLSRGHHLVGIVRARAGREIVSVMEREHTTEFLIPITGPVVQAVGPPGDLTDNSEQPESGEVRVFVIWPGQAIVMAPSTWQCAAMPLADEAIYYFVTEPPPPESPRHANPWVTCRNGDAIRVVIDQ